MTRQQLTTFFIFTTLLAQANADTTYKGVALGIDNFKEFAHLGNDPYVEKTTATVTGMVGYQKTGNIDLNYQGEVSFGVGTYYGAKLHHTDKRTKPNAILTTTHTATVSKTLGDMTAELGVSALAQVAYINARQHYQLDGVIGVSRAFDDKKVGLRYQRALKNTFVYQDCTLQQPNAQSLVVYAEKAKPTHTDGISIGYQQAEQATPKQFNHFVAYEPDSQRISLTWYRKF